MLLVNLQKKHKLPKKVLLLNTSKQDHLSVSQFDRVLGFCSSLKELFCEPLWFCIWTKINSLQDLYYSQPKQFSVASLMKCRIKRAIHAFHLANEPIYIWIMTLKQFKCIHEWDLIGMVSFTWYSAFQKLKKEHHQILPGAPKSCRRKQKRIIAEFMFLDSSKI